MGLINNGLRRAGPSTVYGIGTASLRLPQASAGAMRIRYACTEGVSRVIGIPSGYHPPISWSIPQKGGAMVCRALGESSATGTIAGGINLTCDIIGELTTTGNGAAVAALSCSITGTLTTTAIMAGIANITCDVTGVLVATATHSAIAHASSAMFGELTTTATLGASASMTCELLASGTELTVDDIANAVWNFSTRELTSGGGGGASAADIWSYVTRTLTTTGVTAIQSGLATSAEITAAQSSIEANQAIINIGVQKASKLIPHSTSL